MRTDRTNEWLKGGTSYYYLKTRKETEDNDRSVVLCGRTWVIKSLSD